ncbi:hypothetical protein V492_08055, partial [Pseudogymnoascus sp. VKM F-4246]
GARGVRRAVPRLHSRAAAVRAPTEAAGASPPRTLAVTLYNRAIRVSDGASGADSKGEVSE